ncbi:Detected protein of unknown function [Hibiscus syriacus]|uniref:ENTH domain-containing protein n=1 Tax=Hibiscus syriacus TaxID=106335 RepID=A0A6A3AXC4_HIBSY|nr:Detected protein of unknown function [Hibiscus syriacus]
MPSKLKRAIGAVKDQTCISLAKIVNTNSSNLDVAVLKATTRDPEPADERYVNEILQTISSNKLNAAICAKAIARRIGKTKNWVEVLHARNRGAKILNLTTFEDYSHSSPYDFTAFVRAFAFYLDQRLDCFITGKLQRILSNKEKQSSARRCRRVNQQPVREMKPPMLLDRILYWQRLLDRAIATKPTGAAKNNRLVQVSLYAILQESFDLYRDISDGLGLLLDSFFHLQHQSCINAFQYCVKATKQFEELSSFYDYSKELGIGKNSEYPRVQQISEELMETLQEFLKDQASFPSQNSRCLPFTSPADDPEEPQHGSRCILLEDLMCQTDCDEPICPSFSPGHFSEAAKEQCHEQDDMYNVHETGSNHSLPIHHEFWMTRDLLSFDDWLSSDNKSQELQSSTTANSNNDGDPSFDNRFQQDHEQDQASENGADDYQHVGNGRSLFLDDWLRENRKEPDEQQKDLILNSSNDGYKEGWELVFAETTTQPAQASQHFASGTDQKPIVPQGIDNPFLEDEADISVSIKTTAINSSTALPDEFSMAPTFQAAPPTFFAQGPNDIASPTFQAMPTSLSEDPNSTTEAFHDNVYDDPFTLWPAMEASNNASFNGLDEQQNLLLQQQLRLQNQDMILNKNVIPDI